MVIRRHILRALCAVVLLTVPGQPAKAERRALRRAVVNAVQNNQSNLLQRMFSPGGAAWRGGDQSRCSNNRVTIQPAPIYINSSNGTVYDRFSYDSFPGRYAIDPIRPDAIDALATSSNYANVYAPAVNRVPGMPSVSGPAPGSQYAANNPRYSGAAGIRQSSIAAEPTVSEALWQIGRQRRQGVTDAPPDTGLRPVGSSPMSRFDSTDAASLKSSSPTPEARPTPPQVSTETTARQVDISLRTGARAFQRGDYAAAREAYLQSMILGCNDTRARLGLALADFAIGNFKEASKAVQAELMNAPHLDRSSLDLRRAYGRPEEFDAHLTALQNAAQPGDDPDLLFMLGYMRYHAGDRAGGRAAWSQCLALKDLNPVIADSIRQLSR